MAESVRESVLITGASGGIGEEFARLFASKGYDLVLASRNEAKLRVLAASLAAAHSIRAEILAVDLSVPASAQALESFLAAQGIETHILVNNAGFGTFGAFADNDLAAELAQIQLNVTTLTHLTKLILPGMLRRGRGKILNVASTAAFQPGPFMAVYYATKAYVLSFSEALSNELQGSGVTVTCLCPGGTRTGFMARAKMGNPEIVSRSSVMMEAAVVARRGFDGLMKGKRLVIPGFLNKLLAHSTRLGSRGLNAKVVRRILEAVRSTGEGPAK
jgi:short-subunit dehydrogenase